MWLFVFWEISINTLPSLSSGKELLLAGHVGSYKWWMLKALKKGGKSLGTITCLLLEVSRGEVLPCRAVSHFCLTFPMSLVWHFLERKWYFPAGMMLWLDMSIFNACLIFFTPFQQGWQTTTVFYLLPRHEAAHPCKSCCASTLQAWQPFPQAHSLPGHTFTSWSFATLGHLLWDTYHPTISIFFLEIQNRGLIFCTVFWLIFLMEWAIQEPGHLTCEKQDRLCFNCTFLWLSLGTASQCSSAWSLCPQPLSQNHLFIPVLLQWR